MPAWRFADEVRGLLMDAKLTHDRVQAVPEPDLFAPGTLLVPELHPVNLWLWNVVGWMIPVHVGRVHASCVRWMNPRLKRLDLDRVLSPDTAHCFRAGVVKHWEALLKTVRARNWHVRYEGRRIDFTAKACQELARHHEQWLLFQDLQEQSRGQARAIDSAFSRYLGRMQGRSVSSDQSRWVRLLSQLNVGCDRGWTLCVILWRLLGALGVCGMGLVVRAPAREQLSAPIRYLWDAVNLNEVALSSGERHFAWIIDGKDVEAREVLFVLPPRTSGDLWDVLQQQTYQVVRGLSGVSARIPRRHLWESLGVILRAVPAMLAHALVSTEGLLRAQALSQAMHMTPVIRGLRPQCYVTSASVKEHEPPAIAYLNAVGIPTVMYFYSANSHHFGSEACSCDFRSIFFAHVLARHLVGWHPHHRAFLASHPQDGTTVHAMGPLMAGDETVMGQAQGALIQRYTPWTEAQARHYKVVAVFDEAVSGKRRRLERGMYPLHCTDAYGVAFLGDVLQLLEACEELVVVLKPQFSLRKPTASFGEEFQVLSAAIQEHPRGIILADDINPWVPIAMADLCLGMPFSSPVQAGWHYGIPGIYHDATGICRRHRYGGLDDLITHDYETLQGTVRKILAREAADGRQAPARVAQLKGFTGPTQGTNTTERFRQFLKGVGEAGATRPPVEATESLVPVPEPSVMT